MGPQPVGEIAGVGDERCWSFPDIHQLFFPAPTPPRPAPEVGKATPGKFSAPDAPPAALAAPPGFYRRHRPRPRRRRGSSDEEHHPSLKPSGPEEWMQDLLELSPARPDPRAPSGPPPGQARRPGPRPPHPAAAAAAALGPRPRPQRPDPDPGEVAIRVLRPFPPHGHPRAPLSP